MRKFSQSSVIACTSLFMLFAACTSGMTKGDQTVVEEDRMFVGEGSAADFSEARNNAYSDVITKAAQYIMGSSKFDLNKDKIEQKFLSYAVARKYILGEIDKVPAEKQKKWISNMRNTDGNLVLKMQAYVYVSKLKSDIEALDLKESDNPVNYSSSSSEDRQASTNSLNIPDLSSLTFLVFYNSQDPSINQDPDQVTYSKWAIDGLNRELSSLNVKTFDLETVEKLADERTLIQEEGEGNVGVGLALAQKVYAELYAEVLPSVAYEGDKASVFINVKVYIRTTGALISTIEKSGQQYESSSLDVSIKMSMHEAYKKIISDLRQSLKNYVENGRFYFIRLTGVKSYRYASKFLSAVKKIDGVVDITLKSGSKDDMVYDFNLQYMGNPTDAVDSVLNKLSDKEGFEKLDLKEIRGNELTFSME